MLARRGTWAHLAALAALSVVAAFLPLADHLGYELCEMVAVCAGSLGAGPGIAAARLELSRADGDARRALGRGVAVGLAALAIPLAVILLNGVRRPACDPLGGLILYLLLPVPSALVVRMFHGCRSLWSRLSWPPAAASSSHQATTVSLRPRTR